MKRQKGFSLIELLIVVAIILIIAAIAIPNLLRSRMAANQASAVGSLRTLVTANISYDSTYGVRFSPSLGALGGPAGAAAANCGQALLIDSVLSNAGAGNTSQKSGYTFTYVPGAPYTGPLPAGCVAGVNNFTVTAVPVVLNQTGQNSYCVDESGVVRFNPTGVAPAAPCSTSGLNPIQ